jgi:hypothetical protein
LWCDFLLAPRDRGDLLQRDRISGVPRMHPVNGGVHLPGHAARDECVVGALVWLGRQIGRELVMGFAGATLTFGATG